MINYYFNYLVNTTLSTNYLCLPIGNYYANNVNIYI